MRKLFGLIGACATAGAAVAGAPLIQDNFDGYADTAAFTAVWPLTGANGLAISTLQAQSPTQSVISVGDLARRHYRDFGVEAVPTDENPLVAEFWMYVPASNSNARHYCELRGYSGAGYNQGTLDELYAIGMWNAAPANVTRYQGRIAFPSGINWVNLDDPGAPTRSVGWHKFAIRVKAAGVVEFYVDDVLSKTVTDTTPTPSLDCFILGSALTSTGAIAVHFDDVRIEITDGVLPPTPPSVETPLVADAATVTVNGLVPNTTDVSVYAVLPDTSEILIGTIDPDDVATSVDVPVIPLGHLWRITAEQTNGAGTSLRSAAREVGIGNGPIKICIGIRETGDLGPIGSQGTTTGAIEWIGATSVVSGAPQGTDVAVAGGWQTLVFDPLLDPITNFVGGDNLITGTRGTLEHLAIAVNSSDPDRSVGPFALYVDNVVNVGAGDLGEDVLIADFDSFADGLEVLFQEPGNSGTTDGNLINEVDGSSVSSDAGRGGKSQLLAWAWVDTNANRWARVTTGGGLTNTPSPIIDLTKPIRLDVLLTDVLPSRLPGDANCDGVVNFDDIDCFIASLIGPESWDDCGHQEGCNYEDVNDCNADDAVNFDDIDAFINILIGA